MKHVAIIGNGIAGVTAARYIRKLSNYRITIISGESDYFWSRTALMYIYMGQMKFHHTKPYEDHFWPKNKIDLVHDWVLKINTDQKQLHLKSGKSVNYDVLIIASGSKPRPLGCKGENLNGVSSMVSLQDLHKIEQLTKNISHGIVIGGGLIGIELAEMLLSRNINVTFLVREKSFWDMVLPPQESQMINEHIRQHHVDLQLNEEVDEILANDDGSMVTGIKTKNGKLISAQFIGVAVGVVPQIDLLEGTGISVDRGILVDEYLQTNFKDVYAIGDCAQHNNPPYGRKSIEQIWYTGRIQGETVAKTICGHSEKYTPGIFFNSAKFFNLEYQIYGEVPPNEETEDYGSFFWQNELRNKCLRIVFDKETSAVKGINVIGIRYRQAVCEEWIAAEMKVEEVINDLKRANFDPEFHKKHEEDIKRAFIESFPEKPLPPSQKKGFRQFFKSFL